MIDNKTSSLLTTRQYYTIQSKNTGLQYISPEHKVYLFEGGMDAQDFIKKTPDTADGGRKYFQTDVLLPGVYACGADIIVARTNDGATKEIKIEEEDVKRNDYNRDTVFNIILLKETKEKKYLEALSSCKFVIGCICYKREKAQYMPIHYAGAAMSSGEKVFFLFTNIPEFDRWNEANGRKFSPLYINLIQFRRLAVKRAAVVSPDKYRLYIGKDELDIVNTGANI